MQKTCQGVWENCLAFIGERINSQSFSTWFSPIVPTKLEASTLTIQVPSHFFYEWLEEHYLGLLHEVIVRNLGPDGKLEYAVVVSESPASSRVLTQHERLTPCKSAQGHPVTLLRPQGSSLNPDYCFSSLVEGPCNQLAKSAAEAVAQRLGTTSFNPLVVYGQVGLGKTHIVQAIGNAVLQTANNVSVLYTSADTFTAQFIDALRNGQAGSFAEGYAEIDLLIVDDIQFLVGKEKTQEIFFHIFNHLHQKRKQIVLTSDAPVRALKGLQDRLLSRFKWGLTADLQKPDFETRVAIIQRKLQTEKTALSTEAVYYIARHVSTNVRELEGVVVSVIAHATLQAQPISQSLIDKVLHSVVDTTGAAHVGVDHIQETVAAYYGIEPELVRGRSRKKLAVVARQVAMYLSKECTDASFKHIGYHFGGRDHSTVLHAVQVVSELCVQNISFKKEIETVQQRIELCR